jgi:hypothetical protein
MCTVLLPPGVNPVAVKRYTKQYHSKGPNVDKKRAEIICGNDKLDIVAKVNAHSETSIDLASKLGLLVSTLNIAVGKFEAVERRSILCARARVCVCVRACVHAV